MSEQGCTGCGKVGAWYKLEECSMCGKLLCVTCKAEGCCNNTPAITVEDDALISGGLLF